MKSKFISVCYIFGECVFLQQAKVFALQIFNTFGKLGVCFLYLLHVKFSSQQTQLHTAPTSFRGTSETLFFEGDHPGGEIDGC